MPTRKASSPKSRTNASPVSREALQDLLAQVQQGRIAVADAVERLALLPFQDLGFAKVDHHRTLRRGFPEVVFGQGKTDAQVVSIAKAILAFSPRLLVTRVPPRTYRKVRHVIPDARYHALARAIVVDRATLLLRPGVAVVTAGTSDLPVAAEAEVTAELLGSAVERFYDCGVAGLHRLLAQVEGLRRARVVVVAAGMDAALPSVVAGLVDVPVIGVPTSVGYGANLQGIAPLLSLLNSCVPGVCAVNVDNGFGAGYLAGLINTLPAPEAPMRHRRRPRRATALGSEPAAFPEAALRAGIRLNGNHV